MSTLSGRQGVYDRIIGDDGELPASRLFASITRQCRCARRSCVLPGSRSTTQRSTPLPAARAVSPRTPPSAEQRDDKAPTVPRDRRRAPPAASRRDRRRAPRIPRAAVSTKLAKLTAYARRTHGQFRRTPPIRAAMGVKELRSSPGPLCLTLDRCPRV